MAPSTLRRGPAFLCAFTLATALNAQDSFTVGNTTIQVLDVVTDLEVPWDLVLGPDGWIWFTEVGGRVSRLDPDNGTVQLVHTLPDVHQTSLTGGLHSLAFHPDFANEPYVYLHYVNSASTSVVKRFLYDESTHSFTSTSPSLLALTLNGNSSHNGSRLITDGTGMFLLCLGDAMASGNAQNMDLSNGKVLRFDPEGGIPADNLIPGSYVYNWGHRNPQGMVRASNGIIYNAAHGQGNDDEVNILLPGRNYGWPAVLGLCSTPAEITYCETNDVVEPIHEFTSEVVAPAGLDFYDHPSIPEWQNSLLVATLRGKELHHLQLNAAGDAVTGDLAYLQNTHGRLRDVLVHPDGRIFICTSNHDWAGTPAADDDRIIVLVSENIVTHLREADATTVHAWPNPADDVVWIDGPEEARTEVRVCDATGREVLRTQLQGRGLDVTALGQGVHTVHLTTGTEVIAPRSNAARGLPCRW